MNKKNLIQSTFTFVLPPSRLSYNDLHAVTTNILFANDFQDENVDYIKKETGTAIQTLVKGQMRNAISLVIR